MSYTITLTTTIGTNTFTVPVESFNFSEETPVVTNTGGGGTAGRPIFAPLMINKILDANSPSLYLASVTGRHLPTVTLALTRAGSTTPDATFTLSNALITEVRESGNSHGGPFPTEEVIFAFEKIQIISGGNEFGFDLIKNVTF